MSVVVESGKSKIKPLAILVSGVSSLPSLQAATFLLYLHMPDGEETSSLMSLTPPIMGGPPSWPYLSPITFQRPRLQGQGDQGFRTWIWEVCSHSAHRSGSFMCLLSSQCFLLCEARCFVSTWWYKISPEIISTLKRTAPAAVEHTGGWRERRAGD